MRERSARVPTRIVYAACVAGLAGASNLTGATTAAAEPGVVKSSTAPGPAVGGSVPSGHRPRMSTAPRARKVVTRPGAPVKGSRVAPRAGWPGAGNHSGAGRDASYPAAPRPTFPRRAPVPGMPGGPGLPGTPGAAGSGPLSFPARPDPGAWSFDHSSLAGEPGPCLDDEPDERPDQVGQRLC